MPELVELDYGEQNRAYSNASSTLCFVAVQLRVVEVATQADVSGPHVCQRPHAAESDSFGSVARAVLIPDAMEGETVPAVYNCWNHPNHVTLMKD